MRNINGKYNGDYLIIDANTGEIASQGADFTVMSDALRELLKNKAKPLNGAYAEDIRRFGSFFWGMYNIGEPYLQDLTGATVTRLIYLATYLAYDGSLIHDKQCNRDYDNRPLSKEDIQFKLGLSDRAFGDFFREVTDKGVICEKDSVFFVNSKYFSKGSLDRKYFTSESETYTMKIYANAVRALYINATPRSHKTLSYIFRLVPHINRKYNVVCRNPLETNIDKIDKMTLGDFCESVGYGRTHAGTMFKTLFEPTFTTDDGRRASAVRYVIVKNSLDRESFYMFVNPRVYYGGSNSDNVTALGAF